MSKYYKDVDVIKTIGLADKLADSIKDDICDALATLPTIDIVFCEECKFAEKCEQIVVFDIGENQVEGRKIDFCSYGERIDNE